MIPASDDRPAEPRGRWSRPRLRIAGGVLILLLGSISGAAQATPVLKAGDCLPPLAGATLTGKRVPRFALPAGPPALLVLSFTRAGGQRAQQWLGHLSREQPQLAVYPILFFESLPHFLRPLVTRQIARGMAPAMSARSLVVDRQQKEWEIRLGVRSSQAVRLLLIRPSGRILWMSGEPYSPRSMRQLMQQVQASQSGH
jgi:hypothetical protein